LNATASETGTDQPVAAEAFIQFLLVPFAKGIVPKVCQILTFHRFIANAATSAKLLIIVVLAISLPVFLDKLVVWKRAPADRANKMFAMPDLIDGFDILSPNRLPTSMAAKAKRLVVIALAIRLPVVLEKFSTTELLSAHGAAKVIFVLLMPERLYISTAYVLSATVAEHDTSNSSLPGLSSMRYLGALSRAEISVNGRASTN
jgi:hypothetical protein